MCWSGRITLPLLVLAGTGAAIGLATTSSGLRGKVALLVKNQIDVLKVAFRREDIISQLPDDILSEILSSLDLTEAIRTRILSRRWRNICKLRSKLEFDCCKMFGEFGRHHNGSRRHKRRFLKAVYQSLLLYLGQNITTFSMISCVGVKLAADYSMWMQYIATFGVRNLCFKFCSTNCVDENGNNDVVDYFPFPFQMLFKASSLTRVHLENIVLEPSFRGQFNSLRFLTLVAVKLDNEVLLSILSSCSNLEGVYLLNCNLPPMLRISSHSLRLRNLTIEFCPGMKQIDIRAGGLTYFSCFTDEMIKFSLHFVPKLKRLDLSFNGSGTVAHVFREVERSCPGLSFLFIQTKTDELGNYIPAKTNLFSNLRVLVLMMMCDSKADLPIVASIVDACLLLEHLHVMARCPGHIERGVGTWPTRHHAHLKKVLFEGFRGTRYETEFIAYLLRIAASLEQLFIYQSYGACQRDFKRTATRRDRYVIDYEECQLIFKLLMEQALSSKVKLTIEKTKN